MATGQLLQVDRRVLERLSGGDGGTPAPLVIVPGADRVRTLEPGGATSNGRSSSLRPAARRHTGRFLTTVLMTDIVDSTRIVARLGDRRWRELLAEASRSRPMELSAPPRTPIFWQLTSTSSTPPYGCHSKRRA